MKKSCRLPRALAIGIQETPFSKAKWSHRAENAKKVEFEKIHRLSENVFVVTISEKKSEKEKIHGQNILLGISIQKKQTPQHRHSLRF